MLNEYKKTETTDTSFTMLKNCITLSLFVGTCWLVGFTIIAGTLYGLFLGIKTLFGL
jgi:hypothetical protein